MLLFLDIDGVMVPAKGWKPAKILSDGFPAFSDKAVHALLKIIKEDTTIMLTTSHKSNYTITEWKEIFKMRGIIVQSISILDKNVDNLKRSLEIEKWFTHNNPTEDFLIIDDDTSLNELPTRLKANLILTSPMVGLTETHIKEVDTIRKKRA